MPKMVSTVDWILDIPTRMRGLFPNDKPLKIELKAGIPTEVPTYVLKFYTKMRPHVFSDADVVKKKKEDPKPPKPEPKPIFDPEEWLELHVDNIEMALSDLERRDVIQLAKFMRLSGNYVTQSSERLIERIVQDVNVKLKQQEEIEKHKGIER
jgi:hypothetical protein